MNQSPVAIVNGKCSFRSFTMNEIAITKIKIPDGVTTNFKANFEAVDPDRIPHHRVLNHNIINSEAAVEFGEIVYARFHCKAIVLGADKTTIHQHIATSNNVNSIVNRIVRNNFNISICYIF